jgi:starvation-inducible DNA-binding protein
LLDAALADAIDMWTQAKQAHWNVKGPNFLQLHELFDKIASEMYESADTIAERLVQLGGTAHGTVQAVAARTRMTEYPLGAADGKMHVEKLSEALAAFGRHMRKAIDKAAATPDADTADLFTGISRSVDKYLWFVEAHKGV